MTPENSKTWLTRSPAANFLRAGGPLGPIPPLHFVTDTGSWAL